MHAGRRSFGKFFLLATNLSLVSVKSQASVLSQRTTITQHLKHLVTSHNLCSIHQQQDNNNHSKMAPVQQESKYDYDFIVIGGGSGGLAASKEAVKYGKRVALLDFVKPTPHGTTWGIGGTCVNVGCIPKKLMHEAALQGEQANELHYYGWTMKPDGKQVTTHGPNANLKFDWQTLVENVQNNIKSSNFKYRVELREKKVNYINAFSTFVDEHTVELENKQGVKSRITGETFLIATGERPRYPEDCEGAHLSITSDDLFSLPYNPGKTLVVGASYVALECAGFLAGLGNDVTVVVRSILLRGFDQEMAEKVGAYMSKVGVKFLRPCTPHKIEKIRDGEPGLYKVHMKDGNGKIIVEEYNTILMAIGRDPCTKNIGLEKVGVKVNPKTGKIPTNHEQTNVKNIYAVGDILEFGAELTPVAIDAGLLLVRRLYAGGKETFDYSNIPTTVFTPYEYGCVGLSEENAEKKYGTQNLEVFHTHFKPFEKGVTERDVTDCYAKLICVINDDMRVVGFHYLGPNAGEVTQFAALALRMKARKADFNKLVGIHPSSAELFTSMNITKRSGLSPIPQGCCG